MIKNHKQATSAKQTLKDLENNLDELNSRKQEMSDAEFELSNSSLWELIKDIRNEIEEFEELTKGSFHCFKPQKLDDINKILIKARIAKKITQRELADIIGIQEQQIQRYEATDYESVTWTRIQEIAYALNIKFYFETIILIPTASEFQTPDDKSIHCIEMAKTKVKNEGLLTIE